MHYFLHVKYMSVLSTSFLPTMMKAFYHQHSVLLKELKSPLFYKNNKIKQLKVSPKHFSTENTSNDKSREIEETTKTWLKHTVIELSLCPFAFQPYFEKTLSYKTCIEATTTQDVGMLLLQEIHDLLKADAINDKSTSLVIVPNFEPNDFFAFNDFLNYFLNDFLGEDDPDGILDHLQILPFHPQFEFASCGDYVEHYTNRSPYPMFHLLREIEVDFAVKALDGDSSKVWKRNALLMNQLKEKFGMNTVEQIITGKNEQNYDRNEVLNIAHGDYDDNVKPFTWYRSPKRRKDN